MAVDFEAIRRKVESLWTRCCRRFLSDLETTFCSGYRRGGGIGAEICWFHGNRIFGWGDGSPHHGHPDCTIHYHGLFGY